MMTRRAMLMLLACSADAFGQGISSRSVRPQPRGKPSGRPFLARFTDVAKSAGLTAADCVRQRGGEELHHRGRRVWCRVSRLRQRWLA